MKRYISINEVVKDIDYMPIPGRIYIEKSNYLNLKEAFYIVISSKEAKDQEMIEFENDLVPESLVNDKVKSFFDTATFEDIIIVQKENKEQSGADDYLKAIEYYRENDTFLD